MLKNLINWKNAQKINPSWWIINVQVVHQIRFIVSVKNHVSLAKKEPFFFNLIMNAEIRPSRQKYQIWMTPPSGFGALYLKTNTKNVLINFAKKNWLKIAQSKSLFLLTINVLFVVIYITSNTKSAHHVLKAKNFRKIFTNAKTFLKRLI